LTAGGLAEAVARGGGLAFSGGRVTAFATSRSMVSAMVALVSAEGVEVLAGGWDGGASRGTCGAEWLKNQALSSCSSRASSAMPALVIR
jgi:hypothetical protein